MANESEKKWYRGIAISLAVLAAWIAVMVMFDQSESARHVPGAGLATPGMRTLEVIKAIKADDAPRPR